MRHKHAAEHALPTCQRIAIMRMLRVSDTVGPTKLCDGHML